MENKVSYTNLSDTLYFYHRDHWAKHKDRVRGEKTVWVIPVDKIGAAKDDLFICAARDVEVLNRAARDNNLDRFIIVEFGPWSFLCNGVYAGVGQTVDTVPTYTSIIDLAFTGAKLATTLIQSAHPDVKGICCVGTEECEGIICLAGVGTFGKGAIFTEQQPAFFLATLARRHGLSVLAMTHMSTELIDS